MKKVTRQQARSQSARSGRAWTGADRMRLERMADLQIPAATIAKRLRRSESAVRTEARKQRVMLAPPVKQLALTDKRPYGGMSLPPARSVARTRSARQSSARPGSAPGRPQRSRATRPAQNETLF